MIMSLYCGLIAAIYGASVLSRRWRKAFFVIFLLLSLAWKIVDDFGGAL